MYQNSSECGKKTPLSENEIWNVIEKVAFEEEKTALIRKLYDSLPKRCEMLHNN